MMKKITFLLLVGLVFGGATIPVAAFADSKYRAEYTSSDNKQTPIDVIRSFVFKDSNGTIQINPMSKSLYERYNVKKLQEYLARMNKKVLSGQVKVTKNLDYVPVSNVYALSTSSEWTAHWYGYDASLNDKDTKAFVSNCEAIAAGTATATAIFPELAPFTGVTAGYFGLLAQRVTSNNNGKGVYVAITWTGLFYSEPLE